MHHDLVLGLDPGFAALGYAILELAPAPRVVGLGVVETSKAPKKLKIPAVEDNKRRMAEISTALEALLDGKHPRDARTGDGLRALFEPRRVSMVCAEAMSFPRSASVAAKIALTWGAIFHATHRRHVPLMQRSPQSVKLDVVGTIDASKKHVERVLLRQYGKDVRRLLRHYPTGLHEHAFDALAVATACRPR